MLGSNTTLATTMVLETINEIYKNIDLSCAEFPSSSYDGIYSPFLWINDKPLYRNENNQNAFWTGTKWQFDDENGLDSIIKIKNNGGYFP